jgi:hypothetical protein
LTRAIEGYSIEAGMGILFLYGQNQLYVNCF